MFTRTLMWLRSQMVITAPRMKGIQFLMQVENQPRKLVDIQNGLKRTNTAALNSIEDMMVLLVSLARCTSYGDLRSSEWDRLLQPVTMMLQQCDTILQSIITSGHWFATLVPSDFGSTARQDSGMPERLQIQRLLNAIKMADRHLAKLQIMQANNSKKRKMLMDRLASMCIYMIDLQDSPKHFSREPSKPWLNKGAGAHAPLVNFVK